MKNKQNQKYKVLQRLIAEGNITNAYALSVFKVQNLSRVIHQLRRHNGITIKTRDYRQEDGMTVAVYELPHYERQHAKEVLDFV